MLTYFGNGSKINVGKDINGKYIILANNKLK